MRAMRSYMHIMHERIVWKSVFFALYGRRGRLSEALYADRLILLMFYRRST